MAEVGRAVWVLANEVEPREAGWRLAQVVDEGSEYLTVVARRNMLPRGSLVEEPEVDMDYAPSPYAVHRSRVRELDGSNRWSPSSD